MSHIERTVFLSYRRANWATARLVYENLTHHGYDVFMDIERMDSGAFDQILLRQVAARAHFILILTPHALDRCAEPNDWLRAEIEQAMDTRRNIVPLMFDGFNYDSARAQLTGKLAELPTYNAVNVPLEYVNEALERVRTRFLNVPLNVVLHPTSLPLTAEQLNARGASYAQAGDYARAVEDFTAAIALVPTHPVPYNNRGNIYQMAAQDYDRAIADYSQAIALYPNYAEAYFNRAIAYISGKQDYERAIADYDACIALIPDDASLYNNRAAAYEIGAKNYPKALEDYQRAITLAPQSPLAYRNRANVYRALGDIEKADADIHMADTLEGKGVS